MADIASRDENRNVTIQGVSDIDGKSPTNVKVINSLKALEVAIVDGSGTQITSFGSGNKTNNSAVPGSTNGGSLPGVANAAPPTWTETYQVAESMDLSGNQRVTLGTLIAGENLTSNRLNVEPVYSVSSITTQTTTVVKNTPGTLHSIIIPTPVASATVKIYDNTAGSGSVILDTITFPATLLSSGPVCLIFDVIFATGLTIVTAGATMSLGVYYR
jgi:hypothetical protein